MNGIINEIIKIHNVIKWEIYILNVKDYSRPVSEKSVNY